MANASVSYTPESLDLWFEKLAFDWESSFTTEELLQGREIYRADEVSGLDLAVGEAIVSRRIERREHYAVIEWNGGLPEVRSSTPDVFLGRSLAVAGLYEIGELVCEEISPLPPEPSEKISKQDDQSDETEKPSADIKEEPPDETRTKTRLRLRLRALERGLACRPTWVSSHGKGKELPAFGKEARPRLRGNEREALVRLAVLAGKANFSFRASAGEFALETWAETADFIETHLALWDKRFDLVMEGDATLLRRGMRNVDLDTEAKAASGQEMSLRWRLRCDGKWLDQEGVNRLVKSSQGIAFAPGAGLVRLRGDDAESIERWRDFEESQGHVRWPRYMLFSLFAKLPENLRMDKPLQRWKRTVDAFVGGKKEKLPDFLRPYQDSGVRWLANLAAHGCHGILADEMGLGKTIQTLALLIAFPCRKLHHLVVCPASVAPVWVREVETRFPKIETRILGKGHDFRSRKRIAKGKRSVLWIASYTQLRRHKPLLDEKKFGYAILDEAQHVKNPRAKTTAACLAIRAERRIALTGTPIENSALDLWTIYRFLMPGLLAGRRAMERLAKEMGEGFNRRLRRQIAPFVLRRAKAEVTPELPPKVETDLTCPLSDEQRREYRRISEEGLLGKPDTLRTALSQQATHVFALLTRLRQACCDVALLPWRRNDTPSSCKTEAFLNKMNELVPSGRKVLVFSQFTSYLGLLRKTLKNSFTDLPIFELTGKTKDRDRPIQSFQETNGAAVMLAALKAGGVGVNMHAADYVFLMDPWWNPAAESQAIDRAHRIGRRNAVFVYRVLTIGTVEQRVRALQREKQETFEELIGKLDDRSDLASHFESLRELVALREER